MLQQLTDWLNQSYLNVLFSDTTHLSTWLIIPISQSMHIFAVAIVMISVGILNLRLLRVAGTNQPFAGLTERFMPWIWTALLILLATGVVQTIAEPNRELMNVTFRLKMILLVIVVAITAVYQRSVTKDPLYWERSPDRLRVSRFLAGFSLALWLGILAAGRFIAYFDIGQYL
jgi:uncharacterized membrane protein